MVFVVMARLDFWSETTGRLCLLANGPCQRVAGTAFGDHIKKCDVGLLLGA